MLHYILQVVAFQLLFLIIYDIFLCKETFFNLNRVYLLITAILSVMIPFIKIDQIKTVVSKDFVIRLPEVIIGTPTKELSIVDSQIAMQTVINLEPEPISIWNIIFLTGICIATLILVIKIVKLYWLVSKHPKEWFGKLLIVKLTDSTKAFSFFHYIFLGENLNTQDKSTILKHETVHVNQKHTLDLLFFEVFKIIFWFNPLVYIYQNRIATLHEYIADSKAIKQQDKADYYDNLLAQVFETQQFSFVNPFFKHSLIKKRIIMLSKSRSKQINMIKYVLLLPLVFTMLIYTSSYAQIKSINSSSEIGTQDIQDLTDDELKQNLYNELIEMEKDGKSLISLKDFVTNIDNYKYINSRTDYYKHGVYVRFMLESAKKTNTEKSFTSSDFITLKKPLSKQRTYAEYVAWKHTDETKSNWETRSIDRVLRLFVEDLQNLTSEEKKKQDKKLELLKSNDFYHKLVVADYNDYTVYDFGKKKDTFKFNSYVDTTKEDVEIIEVQENLEVPFSIVDETPTFSFCDNLKTNEERKQCITEGITKHVATNFNTTLADSLGLVGRQRINVIFKINKDGFVIDVKARAPHPKLEEEAKRVVRNLPQFIPGKQKGKHVTVPYSLPIIFQIKDDDNNAETSKAAEDNIIEKVKQQLKEANAYEIDYIEVPFGVVDEVPMYETCIGLTSKEGIKKCVSKEISMYVNRNFNTNLAVKLGIKGRHRIAVSFKVTKQGGISGVRARTSHPELEKEAIRVIKNLPKFSKPGKHKGKVVTVLYSLPIEFQVAH